MEKEVKRIGLDYISPFTEVFALLALTKELQTLNNTLKRLVGRDENNADWLRVVVDPLVHSTQAKRGADGT